jgi:membrane associated rhomboid family serine protease
VIEVVREKGRFRFYAIKLCVIMAVVFVLQILFSGFTEMFVLDNTKILQVWRFLTAIFLHGDLGHLMYNGFALLLFGSIVERIAGSRKFLRVFFVSGVLANLISVNFYNSSLGASGAIFGVIGALVVLRPGMSVWAFGMPMPMVVAGILWAVGDFIGAVGYLTGNPMDNTGNIAHLSGMIFGLLFGFLYRKKYREEKRRENMFVIDDRKIRRWEDEYLM